MFISDNNYFHSVILKKAEVDVDKILSDKEQNYILYSIPKKNGTRDIHAIDKESGLYSLQYNLQNNFLCKIQLPVAVKGFVKGESYNSYLSDHLNRKFFLRIDIKSFFDTITSNQIKDTLSDFITLDTVIDKIINICTLDQKLPQGAVTSPTISNIIFRRLDQRIVKYCQSFNVYYSRYADDMLFSSDVIDFCEKVYFYRMIKKILSDNGFECNYSKKRTSEYHISLSGYVVGRDIHLSREKLKNINVLLYFFKKNKEFSNEKYCVDSNIFLKKAWLDDINALNLKQKDNKAKVFVNKTQLVDYLCGYRSFIISVIKSNQINTNYVKQMSKKVKNIECVIDSLLMLSEM